MESPRWPDNRSRQSSYSSDVKTFDGFSEAFSPFQGPYRPAALSAEDKRERELNDRSILAKMQRMLAQHNSKNDGQKVDLEEGIRPFDPESKTRQDIDGSVGRKRPRPALSSIVTSNIPPQSHFHSHQSSGIENYNQFVELFPGNNTPENKLHSLGPALPSNLSTLRQLADLLSPLRSRSSTASSSLPKYQKPHETLSADTQSFTSSYVHNIPQYSSPSANSDPGPRYRVSEWNSVPVVSYRSVPASPESSPPVPLVAWGISPSVSYFELYKPVNIRYPSVWEFSDIKSPVARVNSSVQHTTFSMTWRILLVAHAQEIWQWGIVFGQIQDRTLFRLSAASRQREFMTSKSNEIWKVHRYEINELVRTMRTLYTKQFGHPSWARTDEEILEYLYTCDTCCSKKIREDREMFMPQEICEIRKTIDISMKFGPDKAQVRRYMRQIIVEPSHIYATAGDLFELRLTIWDPHRTFDELKLRTTFALDPVIPWLRYDQETWSFVGEVPANLGVFSELTGAEPGRLTHYMLELGLVAYVRDLLHHGTERETTIRAKLKIWIQNDGHTVMSIFDHEQKTNHVIFNAPPGSRIASQGTEELTRDNVENTDSHSNSGSEINSVNGYQDSIRCQASNSPSVMGPDEAYRNSRTYDSALTDIPEELPFVAARLPRFSTGDEINQWRQILWAGLEKYNDFLTYHSELDREDDFQSSYADQVDSWVNNANIAMSLEQIRAFAFDSEDDISTLNITSPSPDSLAMRNQFWDLAKEHTEDDRTRHAKFGSLDQYVQQWSSSLGPTDQSRDKNTNEPGIQTSKRPARKLMNLFSKCSSPSLSDKSDDVPDDLSAGNEGTYMALYG